MSKREAREFKKRDIVPLTQVSLIAGQSGFSKYDIEVKEMKQDHSIYFFLKVLQDTGRTDLDIGFFLMDTNNYEKWFKGQPNSAFIAIPRLKSGTSIFSPQVTGIYHAVVENRYSILTKKEVMVHIYETWTEERKVEIPVQKEEKKTESKVGRLRRFWNRIRSSKTLRFLGLYVIIQLISALVVVLIAYFLQYALGVEYKDLLGYITTAIGVGTLPVFAYVYYLVTGNPMFYHHPKANLQSLSRLSYSHIRYS